MRPKVLFIDAYDSFANNIIDLLESRLGIEVTVIKIDACISSLSDFLRPFAAVVAGPGPGSPLNPSDIGIIQAIWRLEAEDILPVLGVCLGFQSLVYEFGGSIRRLRQPRHGRETTIISNETSIFSNLPRIRCVQYHSLEAVLDDSSAHEDEISGLDIDCWRRRDSCPNLQPLAWDLASPEQPILMSVRHISKPFHGTQFHPESICSSEEAKEVIENWWKFVEEWNQDNHRGDGCNTTLAPRPEDVNLAENSARETCGLSISPSVSRKSSPASDISSDTTMSSTRSAESTHANAESKGYRKLRLGGLNVESICESLKVAGSQIMILESSRLMEDLGAYTIIGLMFPENLTIKYAAGARSIHILRDGGSSHQSLDQYRDSIFEYLREFMKSRRVDSFNDDSPFWGGLMGYITYEACLETIGIKSPGATENADVTFAFVERSIVINHQTSEIYIQSIVEYDTRWLDTTLSRLQDLSRDQFSKQSTGIATEIRPASSVCSPVEATYKSKIASCQEYIAAGDAYELCLTDQTVVEAPRCSNHSSFDLYRRLCQINPAPFSAYLRLGDLTLLSSSPERFMCWSRTHQQTPSVCQFRPIKGTVKKVRRDSHGQSSVVTIEEATAILQTAKEKAENLMIVDLIRHDLHGVVGSGNVTVPSLMIVEEYETVYQLVSVIEGTLPTERRARVMQSNDRPGFEPPAAKSGLDVLAASLPPGSMTGAPKRRACQILQEVENHRPRSAYSGVLGYMCVGGGGDFSVVIRTAYKWDNESTSDHDRWNIGAGGAVTTLSTEDGEWEEMIGKLNSTLSVFDSQT